MKQILCPLLLVMTVIIAFGQTAPVVKGYAYTRVTLPAIRSTGISEETGAETQMAVKEKISWFIYLEHKPSINIKPTLIWLHGSPHRVTYEKIKQNKVMVNRTTLNDRSTYDTLVKVTRNTIIRIIPAEQVRARKPLAISKKVTTKNAIVEYYRNGKKYYYTIPVVKKLEPLALQ